MTGNVIAKVDAFMYVALSKTEKHLRYGELVSTRECIELWWIYHTNRGRFNQVQ
jgi:hypothetical protein